MKEKMLKYAKTGALSLVLLLNVMNSSAMSSEQKMDILNNAKIENSINNNYDLATLLAIKDQIVSNLVKGGYSYLKVTNGSYTLVKDGYEKDVSKILENLIRNEIINSSAVAGIYAQLGIGINGNNHYLSAYLDELINYMPSDNNLKLGEYSVRDLIFYKEGFGYFFLIPRDETDGLIKGNSINIKKGLNKVGGTLKKGTDAVGGAFQKGAKFVKEIPKNIIDSLAKFGENLKNNIKYKIDSIIENLETVDEYVDTQVDGDGYEKIIEKGLAGKAKANNELRLDLLKIDFAKKYAGGINGKTIERQLSGRGNNIIEVNDKVVIFGTSINNNVENAMTRSFEMLENNLRYKMGHKVEISEDDINYKVFYNKKLNNYIIISMVTVKK